MCPVDVSPEVLALIDGLMADLGAKPRAWRRQSASATGSRSPSLARRTREVDASEPVGGAGGGDHVGDSRDDTGCDRGPDGDWRVCR